MTSNFKKTWSFWGGRKRIDHNFNNSFDEDRFRPGTKLLNDYSDCGNMTRNTFQTRSLRLDRNRIAVPHNSHPFATEGFMDVSQREGFHQRWSNQLQRQCGYQNVNSPHHILVRSGDNHAQHNPNFNQFQQEKSQPMPQYMNLPCNSQAMEESFHEELDEPIYENLESVKMKRQHLLPRPNFPQEGSRLGGPSSDFSHISPHNIRRPPLLPLPNRINPFWDSVQDNVRTIGPNAEETFTKGNKKLNKAFQGICTSVRSLSQKFKKTTKRQYKLDDSPSTPKENRHHGHRVTPGKLVPFDVNTPVTPHSFRKGPKRLHSARRLSRENLTFLRTPGRGGNTRGNPNWVQFHSPARNSPVPRFRQF